MLLAQSATKDYTVSYTHLTLPTKLIVYISVVAVSLKKFFFQAEDGIRDLQKSRGLGDVYKRQVSWCFEPSQPQRITSELNTNFNLSASYSFHESLYHKPLSLSQNTAQILPTISERKTRILFCLLVSWCFKPSQPQRITSELNTNFTVTPS